MAKKVGIETKYINPFLTSTINVFKTMINIMPRLGEPFLERELELHGEVAVALIGIAGEVKGNVNLIMQKELALVVASKLIGQPMTELNNDVCDALGEITNMIVGGAKKFFAERDESFKIAVPTVVTGTIKEIYHEPTIPSLYLPFILTEGTFYLETCLIKEAK